MRPLRDLLTTWENWSAPDTLTRALGRAATEEGRDALRRGLAETPQVDPLDALRDVTELVALVSGWRWQAVNAARLDGAGWDEVGAALGVSGDEACSGFVAALDRQEYAKSGVSKRYREQV